jgi:hypothetical protein
MANITSIQFALQTADVSGAGTDGDVYLGFCGREFSVDTSADDFERDSSRTYTFGEGANVQHAAQNDPRLPQLRIENIDRFPVYVRFGPQSRDDNWKLLRAEVSVHGQFFPRWDTGDVIPFGEAGGIVLGTHAGLVVQIPLHAD